jgi:branched-chain amino acid transport system permease protein
VALQQLVNALVFGSVLTLFALGLSLAWGTLDVLNLAHGSLFVFAGFLAYEFSSHVHMAFVFLVISCMVATGIVAALMEAFAFRHVRLRFPSKRQAEMSMMVASIGFSTMIDTIIANQTSDTSFGPAPTAFTVTHTNIGSVVITNIEIIIVAVTVVVAIALDQWVRRSRMGRAVRSIAFDPDTSGLLGINVNRLAAITMFLAGALAGLAGVLLAVYAGAEDTTSGQSYMLTAFAILIVGGVGSVRGAIAAAFFISIAETAVVAYGPSNWSNGVAFLLILVVLLVRPAGLFARSRFQRT